MQFFLQVTVDFNLLLFKVIYRFLNAKVEIKNIIISINKIFCRYL